MGFALFGMSDLIFNSKKLKGKQGVGNATAVYPDASIEAGIARTTADSKAAKKLAKNFRRCDHARCPRVAPEDSA